MSAVSYRRRTSFAIVVIALVAFMAILTGVLYRTLAAAAQAEPDTRDYLMRLAAMTTAVLVLSAVLLFGTVIRYIASRITGPADKFKPTPYEDAWTEAGRRLKPEDAPPVQGFEDEDQAD